MTVQRHRARDNGPDHEILLKYLHGIRGVLTALAGVLIAATGLLALILR